MYNYYYIKNLVEWKNVVLLILSLNYVLIQVNDLTLTVSRSINIILIILIPIEQQYKTTLSNYTGND